MVVYYPDEQVWWAIAQDEQDALELGWRATNALIADNDPNPSIGFSTLDDLSYQQYVRDAMPDGET